LTEPLAGFKRAIEIKPLERKNNLKEEKKL
jgi:hypothetical protein